MFFEEDCHMNLILDNDTVNPPPAPSNDFIVDVDVKNFMAEVIEASRQRLVLVDFWAPWCGPCKQLVPLLEKLVIGLKGAVRLAKVNIDANASIATQLRVQSVPTVFAFFQGQPVDGFTGAVQESQLKAWLERLVTATNSLPPGEQDDTRLEEALTHGQGALEEGDIETARLIFTDILKQAPMEARAFAGMVRCLLAEGKTDMAAEIVEQAHPDIKKNKVLEPVRTAIAMAREAASKANQMDQLSGRVAANPDDHEARYDLAMACYAAGDNQGAIDALLEIVRRDRKWNDEAARKQIVKLFEVFGPTDPLTIETRKRLSSILFA